MVPKTAAVPDVQIGRLAPSTATVVPVPGSILFLVLDVLIDQTFLQLKNW